MRRKDKKNNRAYKKGFMLGIVFLMFMKIMDDNNGNSK